MGRFRIDDRGSVSAEHVATILLIGAVIAALVSITLPRRVEEVAEVAVDCLFQGESDDCELGTIAAPPTDEPDEDAADPADPDEDLDYDDPEVLEEALARLPEGSQILDEDTGEVLWESGDGLTGDPDVDAILTTLAQLNDHLRTVVGRDSIDDAGLPLVVNLNVRTGSAYWDPREGSDHFLETAYADGWAQPHVIAHEFGHGLVYFVVDFHEKGHTTDEQRSMNEGFGDIVSFNVTGVTDRADPDTGDVYRSMRDPEAQGQPTHVDDFDLNSGCSSPPCIHNNSSIVSHAYYLMVEGADGDDGVGLETAQEIFYDALPRMDTDSDLVAYRDTMLGAAADLHGTDSDEYRQVRSALDAVGLDADFEGI